MGVDEPVRARPPEANCAPPRGAANIVSVGVIHPRVGTVQ